MVLDRVAWLFGIVTAIAAACAAAAQPAESSTEELLERFTGEPVFWRQLEIAKVLAAREDARVLIPLETMLSQEDRHVRANVAFVFARLGDPRGFATIDGILADWSDRPINQDIPRPPSNPAQARS